MPELLQRVSEGKRGKTLSNWQWREFAGQKAHRGRLTTRARRREYFVQERGRVMRFREQAEEERQAGIRGRWQLESPAREYLEQVKSCNDTDCTHRMKQGFVALKSGDGEEYKNTF